jgi:hypothetical protein
VTPINPITNYGRLRRLANRYCYGVIQQTENITLSAETLLNEREPLTEHRQSRIDYELKNNWEALIFFLLRMRRCLLMLQKLSPEITVDPKYLERFESLVPKLKSIRDFEEHFDDYSLGKGRDSSLEWGFLESYVYGADMFSNGVGTIELAQAKEAALTAWEAVLSCEESAKQMGFLTFDDRYGPDGKFRRSK